MSSWYQPTSPQSDSEPLWSLPDTRRSTWALIETCILTLVLCSWTAIHLDIPPPNRRRSFSTWIWKRLKWSIVGILAPEYLLWIAFMEYWESRQICLELEKVEKEKMEKGMKLNASASQTVQCLPGSNNTATTPPANSSGGNARTHSTNDQSHSPDINGSTPRGTDSEPSTRQSNDEKTAPITTAVSRVSADKPGAPKVDLSFHNLVPDKLEHGFYIEMGGYELEPSEGIDIPSDYSGRVTSRGAIELDKYGELQKPPLELIKDQSKTDILAKVLVCLQASWMVVQCIARVAQGLPLSLLEINTMMHVMCAILMYWLWFKKPHDLIIPTKILVDEEKLKRLKKIVDSQPPGPRNDQGEVPIGLKLTEPLNDKSSAVDLGSCRTSQSYYGIVYGGILGLFTSTIYGGVHLSVWNGHFPTRLERGLWRISGLIILGMPFFLATFLLLIWSVQKQWMKERNDRKGFWYRSRNGTRTYHPTQEIPIPKESSSYWRAQYKPHVAFLQHLKEFKHWGWYFSYMLLIILQIIASLCYGLARAYLVFEAFASLRNLPVGSYSAVRWTSFIPHF